MKRQFIGSLASTALLVVGASAQFPNPVTLPSTPAVETATITGPNYDLMLGQVPAAVGDLNGDGYDDFAIGAPEWSPTPNGSSTSFGACYVFFGGPNWSGTASLDVSALNGTRGFVVTGEELSDFLGAAVDGAGDVNGDGFDDLLIGAPGLDDPSGASRGGAYVLSGGPSIGAGGVVPGASVTGSVGFRVLVPQYTTFGGRNVAGLGDVDRDGIDDFGLTDARQSESQPTFSLGTNITEYIDSGDMDGDGDIDVVVVQTLTSRFLVLYNNGGLQFSAVPYPLTVNPEQLKLVDMDQDGDLDVVSVTKNAQGRQRLTVVMNQSNGLFGPTANYFLGDAMLAFDVADMDGDGFPDAVATTYDGYAELGDQCPLYVLQNDGTGALQLQPPVWAKDEPRVVRTDDLDGDGDLDVGVAVWSTNEMQIFRNDGYGGLSALTLGAHVVRPDTMRFGDIDGDGDVDVVVAGSGIAANRNLGNMTFGSAYSAAPNDGSHFSELLLHDFDGDGDLDALLSCRDYSNQVSAYINDGNGYFTGRTTRQDVQAAYDLALGDFDGDGFEDAAAPVRLTSTTYGVLFVRNSGSASFCGMEGGAAYVLRGGPAVGTPSTLDLTTLAPARGFVMRGRAGGEWLGSSLARLGDFDLDGDDDFCVGDPYARLAGNGTGAFFVVRGASGLGSSGELDVRALSGPDGFAVHDQVAPGGFGSTRTQPCDVDADGWPDLVFGSSYETYSATQHYGAAYVVFGSSTLGLGGDVRLAYPDGINVLQLRGFQDNTQLSYYSQGCGDLNGDGFDDALLGAPLHDETLVDRGAVFVAYGHARPFGNGVMTLDTLDGSNGFRVLGSSAGGNLGAGVRCVGDIDGDGVDDMLVGESRYQVSSYLVGRAFLVLGQRYGAPVTYCSAQTNSQGCAPSIGWSGALPSVSDLDAFHVVASSVINQQNGILFYGLSGRSAAPFLGGTLCVRQPLTRTPLQSSGGSASGTDCSGGFDVDWRAWMTSGADPNLAAGTAIDAQFWSRDPLAQSTTNLTGGIEFTIGP